MSSSLAPLAPAVVFDAYGTLLDLPSPRQPYAQLRAFLKAQGCEVSGFPRQAMTRPQTLAGLLDQHGVPAPAGLLAAWEADLFADLEAVQPYPEAERVLRHVLGAGATVVVASNLAWPYACPVRALVDAVARPMPGAPACRTHLALSFQLGSVKPEPLFYQAIEGLLAEQGIAPSRICMVGDRLQEDQQAPQARGWNARRIDRAAGEDLWSVPWDDWLSRPGRA